MIILPQALDIERIACQSADQTVADLRSTNAQFQELIRMLKAMQAGSSNCEGGQ